MSFAFEKRKILFAQFIKRSPFHNTKTFHHKENIENIIALFIRFVKAFLFKNIKTVIHKNTIVIWCKKQLKFW